MKKLFSIALLAAATFTVGCGDDDTENNIITPPGPTGFRQVEQLARPAVAEGLLFTNSLLNTYNSVGPAFVAAALANAAGPEGQAAAPIFAEATTVLTVLENLNAAPNVAPLPIGVAGKVAAFLPDVMRIDTTVNVPVAGSAYAAALNAVGSPVAGRKLTDDVVDITLTVLTDGAITTDNVPYYPVAGNHAVGHHRLNGQAADNGAATFPFLAPAN